MNPELKEELLDLFRKFFPRIGRRDTRMWRCKNQTGRKTGIKVECRNGTKNYIVPDTCALVLHEWNKKHPELKLKEVERYCIEDGEIWTWIIWGLEFDND
jgi:hypothetical protein